jgi:hypothetical protein
MIRVSSLRARGFALVAIPLAVRALESGFWRQAKGQSLELWEDRIGRGKLPTGLP